MAGPLPLPFAKGDGEGARVSHGRILDCRARWMTCRSLWAKETPGTEISNQNVEDERALHYGTGKGKLTLRQDISHRREILGCPPQIDMFWEKTSQPDVYPEYASQGDMRKVIRVEQLVFLWPVS